jgi:dihydroneopterin aldolase
MAAQPETESYVRNDDVQASPDLVVAVEMLRTYINYTETGILVEAARSKRHFNRLAKAASKNTDGIMQARSQLQAVELELLKEQPPTQSLTEEL